MVTTRPAEHDATFVLFLWSHRALYAGPSPENELHRHHAAQLCVGLDATLHVGDKEDSARQDMRAVFVPPDRPHVIDAESGRVVAIYWEPESTDYPFAPLGSAVRALSLPDHGWRRLRQMDLRSLSPVEAWAECAAALDLPVQASPTPLDPRIADTVEYIRHAPGEPHTLHALAERAHLSPSRLSHLFSEQVGVTLRRFIVWNRARYVVGAALSGASLTEAAHAAGFSDAAHMSHTFRGMFGFAPSTLFSPSVPKHVYLVHEAP